MGFTLRLLPHDSQDMKKIRFSFVRSVSGDLQVLQVTYSTTSALAPLRCKRKEKLTNIPPQDVFDLFLLEATFYN